MSFKIDPWLKRRLGARASTVPLVLACSYDLDLGLFNVEEVAYFRRLGDHDELWLRCYELKLHGCAVTGPSQGTPAESCLDLLEQLCRARIGSGWPSGVTGGGLVTAADFQARLRRIEREIDRNRRRTRGARSDMVRAARRLGLAPKATGTGMDRWQAQCPQKNHYLMISADSNEFGCGYCRERGGVAELAALVERRRVAVAGGSGVANAGSNGR